MRLITTECFRQHAQLAALIRSLSLFFRVWRMCGAFHAAGQTRSAAFGYGAASHHAGRRAVIGAPALAAAGATHAAGAAQCCDQ
jgi:hypothetical protein